MKLHVSPVLSDLNMCYSVRSHVSWLYVKAHPGQGLRIPFSSRGPPFPMNCFTWRLP